MPEATTVEAAQPTAELSFLDPLVGWIRARGLQAPATFVLEIHRPLMPMAYPAAVMAGTFIAPFCGGPGYYEKIEALRDPAALDWMLKRLSDPNVAHASGLRPDLPSPLRGEGGHAVAEGEGVPGEGVRQGEALRSPTSGMVGPTDLTPLKETRR